MVSGKQVLSVSKYVVPRPDKGVVGVVVPLGILTGAYIVLTRFNIPVVQQVGEVFQDILRKINPLYPSWKATADALGLPEPDPVFGQWGNAINDIANAFVPNIYIWLVPSSAARGETIRIGVANLKPNTRFIYGWKPLGSWPGYTEEFTSNDKGEWIPSQYVVIDLATPVGIHKIYIDQRTFGGKYAERSFEVLAGAF